MANLQWALYGLVRRLDDAGAYGSGWIERSAAEIRQPTPQGSIAKYEKQLREHLAAINQAPGT